MGPGFPQPYPYGPGPTGPMPPKKSGMSTGVIIAIVAGVIVLAMIALVGILAVLGIYGTRKYIANAKTAEARNALAEMAKDAAAAYESEDARLCPSARSPVPASIQDVSAKKYQSSLSDWQNDPGFSCLQFEMSTPQYYQYDYKNVGNGFSAIAKGDLNGDGVTSTFEITGRLESGRLIVAPAIVETNPDE